MRKEALYLLIILMLAFNAALIFYPQIKLVLNNQTQLAQVDSILDPNDPCVIDPVYCGVPPDDTPCLIEPSLCAPPDDSLPAPVPISAPTTTPAISEPRVQLSLDGMQTQGFVNFDVSKIGQKILVSWENNSEMLSAIRYGKNQLKPENFMAAKSYGKKYIFSMPFNSSDNVVYVQAAMKSNDGLKIKSDIISVNISSLKNADLMFFGRILSEIRGPFSSGMKKSGEVEKLQIALSVLGHYNGAINGNYNKATTEAVKKFQQANNIEASGMAGPSTRAKINDIL